MDNADRKELAKALEKLTGTTQGGESAGLPCASAGGRRWACRKSECRYGRRGTQQEPLKQQLWTGSAQLAEALRKQSAPSAGTASAQLVAAARAAVTNPALAANQQNLAALRAATRSAAAIQRNPSWIASLQAAQEAAAARERALTAALKPTLARPVTPASRLPTVRRATPPRQQRARPRPWHEAAIHIRARVITLVVERNPDVLETLEGAWERIVRGGPHSASQAAHSVVEFVDWTLRREAPDEPVLRWHRDESRPAGELSRGRPTRQLRMRYILRNRDPDSDAAKVFVRHANDVLRLLQGVKHTPSNQDRRVVTASILSLEAVLVFLFAGVSS